MIARRSVVRYRSFVRARKISSLLFFMDYYLDIYRIEVLWRTLHFSNRCATGVRYCFGFMFVPFFYDYGYEKHWSMDEVDVTRRIWVKNNIFVVFSLISENVPLAMGKAARRSVANNPSTPYYDTYIVEPKSKSGAGTTTTSSGETTTSKIPTSQTSTPGNYYSEAAINATAR